MSDDGRREPGGRGSRPAGGPGGSRGSSTGRPGGPRGRSEGGRPAQGRPAQGRAGQGPRTGGPRAGGRTDGGRSGSWSDGRDGDRRPPRDGDRRPARDGDRRSSFDGDRRPARDGDRRPSFDGDRRPPRDGDRRPSFDGDRRPPRDGDRRPPRDGDRRPPRDGDRRPPRDGDRRPPRDGDRRPPRDGERPARTGYPRTGPRPGDTERRPSGRAGDRRRTPEEIAEERRRNLKAAQRGSGLGRGQQGTSGRGVAARGASSRRPAGTGRRGTPPVVPQGGDVDVHVADGVRLQKVLAQAGVGSRRKCEDLIAAGRVSVDGVVVTELGLRVDPERQPVHVDGLRVVLDTTKVYLALNKPLGVVSTMSDPQGRPCVGDLLEQREQRLFHVGRLDVDTEGLLLVTNDGELANRLQHPSWEVPKTYLAQVLGPIPRNLGQRLRDGVELEDGPVTVDSFRLVDSQPGRALVELVLHEGRNHIVRRLMAEVGHPVEQLVRTRIGPVVLGDMLPGRSRPLAAPELGRLMADVGL